MLTVEDLLSIDKEKLEAAASSLPKEELPWLVEKLSEKDDAIRYQALQLLQYRSQLTDEVYPFWDTFCSKLKDSNSYQRSIGLMLIAENTKWDKENRLDGILEQYLELLNDDKPITVRQCIQSLNKIVPYKTHLYEKIAARLMAIDFLKIKETMQKLILTDILTVLIQLQRSKSSQEIEKYINDALTGGILDKKAKKLLESML